MSADEDFTAFVAASWSRLFRLAYLLTADRSDGEDLLQAVMEKTYARWARIGQVEAPEAYVRKLMLNTLISTRRRSGRRRERLADRPFDVSVPSQDVAVVNHTVLWPLVAALPARQRAVIVLRYYEDLTETQTGEVLGCTTGTVKSQAHAAMRAMRKGLQVPATSGEGVREL